jgi:hypothetical protein
MRFVMQILLAVALLFASGLPEVRAAGLEVGKDCHVILTCNFQRGASVRGCLSSYSCRQCQFVKQGTTSIDGVRRSEYSSVCTWGGS